MSFKVLYCALVRPILEYGCIVWDPHTTSNINQIQWVQNKFSWFAGYVLKIPCLLYDYSSVANVLGLSSLAERRRIAGIIFIEGLLNGKIDSTELISSISFKVHQRLTRYIAPFYVSHATTKYLTNEPLRRLMTNANVYPHFQVKFFFFFLIIV